MQFQNSFLIIIICLSVALNIFLILRIGVLKLIEKRQDIVINHLYDIKSLLEQRIDYFETILKLKNKQ